MGSPTTSVEPSRRTRGSTRREGHTADTLPEVDPVGEVARGLLGSAPSRERHGAHTVPEGRVEAGVTRTVLGGRPRWLLLSGGLVPGGPQAGWVPTSGPGSPGSVGVFWEGHIADALPEGDLPGGVTGGLRGVPGAGVHLPVGARSRWAGTQGPPSTTRGLLPPVGGRGGWGPVEP